MFRLIPPYVSEQVSSGAEKRLIRHFRELSDRDLPELAEWVCLHSVNLPEHEYKRMGEIDVLLVGPPGVFVLEVKGGRVSRQAGIWEFTNRDGHVTRKTEGPFDQAIGAMFSLSSSLQDRLPPTLFSQVVFGYAVVFPDINFATDSTEWAPETVLDRRAIGFGIPASLQRLVRYWRSKNHRNPAYLSRESVGQIVDLVRPDFDLVPKPGIRVSEVDADLVRLTREQMRTLDAVESNPRILLEGSAGTGKTLIAMEVARRRAAEGRRVTFLTFNPVLARYLDRQLRPDGVRVHSVHRLMRTITRKYGTMPGEYLPAMDVEDPAFPTHLIPAFMNACECLPENERTEFLVVDETQDLIEQDYLLALERFLIGGFSKGSWFLCHDKERQSLRGSGDFSTQLGLLRDESSTVRLNQNCRNTREIILQTEMYTGIDAGASDLSSRIKVTQVFYRSREQQMESLERFLRESFEDGIPPGDITLLSLLPWSRSVARDLPVDLTSKMIRLSNRSPAEFDRSRITFSTIADFKGLENRVVAILDINDLGEHMRPSLYVAMTRARVKLWMAIDRRMREAATELALKAVRGS